MARYPGSLSLRVIGLVVVLLPVALLSALVVIGILLVAERALEQRLQGEIELIARAASPLVSRHLDSDDRFMVRQSLQGIFDVGRVVYGAAVYDQDGELVGRAGRANVQVRTSEGATEAVATGEEAGEYRTVGHRDVYSHFTPLSGQGGRIIGLLQVNRQRAEIDAALQQLRRTAWLAWGGTVVALGLVLFLGYRRLIEWPVLRLRDGMRAVTDGSRSARIQVRQPREFAELGSAFNSMIAAVEHAEAERELARERELRLLGQLQESEKIAAIGRVAAGIAHELGAPLSVISGRSARIRRREEAGSSHYDAERIDAETRRLRNIVEQLLEYCRGTQREHRSLDLAAVAGSALAAAAAEPEAERLQIDWQPPEQPMRLPGDRVRLEIALTNLIRNALRHANSRVRMQLHADDGQLVFSVADDGSGVPEADREHLFEPFFTRQESGRGTGLGLAIVASVALEHGGEAVYAGSDPELGGARFQLHLPRASGRGIATGTADAPVQGG